MHIYSVLRKSRGDIPLFVEEKISFLALIFPLLWLIYHKVWQPAIIIIVIWIGMYFAFSKELIDNYLYYAVNFVISITVAIFANSWYINALRNSGYALSSVIVATNEDQARIRFLENEDIDVR